MSGYVEVELPGVTVTPSVAEESVACSPVMVDGPVFLSCSRIVSTSPGAMTPSFGTSASVV